MRPINGGYFEYKQYYNFFLEDYYNFNTGQAVYLTPLRKHKKIFDISVKYVTFNTTLRVII